jgi:hypothetical protein
LNRKTEYIPPLDEPCGLDTLLHFIKGDGLFACYIFMYTKIDPVLMPRSETDADNPFVLGDEGYDVFA